MPGRGSYGPGGKWIHNRAHRIMADGETPKGTAYAVATQQAHATGKSPKAFKTPGGVVTARKKYDDPRAMKKTARVVGILKEAQKGTHRGVFDDLNSRTFGVRLLKTYQAALGPDYDKKSGQAAVMQHPLLRKIENKHGLKITGIDTGPSEGNWKVSTQPREKEKRGSADRALVLFSRRNDILNKLAAQLVGSPSPIPMVSTSMTPQTQTGQAQGLTAPKPRSLSVSKTSPNYSQSQPISAGPTQGMGTAAKNVPPPSVKS